MPLEICSVGLVGCNNVGDTHVADLVTYTTVRKLKENNEIYNVVYIHTYKLYLTTLALSAKFAGFHEGREKQNIFASKKNTKRV